MYRLIIICNLLCLLVSHECLKAQDPTYSQVHLDDVFFNPAAAGSEDMNRVTSSYRDQWAAIPGNFPTYYIAADFYLPNINSSIAFTALSDHQGTAVMQTTSLTAAYSYRIILKPRVAWMQAGMQATYGDKQINWDKLVFTDQLDPYYGVTTSNSSYSADHTGTNTISYFDAGAGFLFKGNVYNRIHHLVATISAGFAINHLLQPNVSFTGQDAPIPMTFSENVSALIPMSHHRSSEQSLLIPYVFHENQGPSTQTQFGLVGLLNSFFAGIGYRNTSYVFVNLSQPDAFIFTVGVRKIVSKELTYKIGYSYDATVSKLSGSTAGTQELALMVGWGDYSKQKHKIRRIDSPEF